MGLFDRIKSFFDDWQTSTAGSVGDTPTINPAAGLPMTGGIDAAGNPFGTDLSSHGHDSRQYDPYRSGSSFDDHRTTWHDPFPNGMGGGHDPWRD